MWILTYDRSSIDYAWLSVILDALEAIIVAASPASRDEPGTKTMGELYGRYHGRILRLATQATSDGAWKAKLREILAEFDNDCWELSESACRLLRRELAAQIDHEVLCFADPTKRAILGIALKHFDDD